MTTVLAGPVWSQGRTGILHFAVNPTETTITAAVAEPMARIRGNATGSFKVISGTIQGDPSAIADTGKVNVVIDAASYASDSRARDEAVKRAALEVKEFPTITFAGDQLRDIDKDSTLSARLRLHGQLTLHGVTRDIELPVVAYIDGQGRFTADGTYTFRFEPYGVKRPSLLRGLMVTGDQATIVFHIVADPA